MGEMADLLTEEQATLWFQHKYGVCGDDCPYCNDEDCPPVQTVDAVDVDE